MMVNPILLLAFSATVLAAPSPHLKQKPPEFKPEGPGDVRSPCPLLDSLANHNIIPHNGKGITIDILKTAFKQYVNVGHDVAVAVGDMGLALSNKKNSFDLDDLNQHNAIEHDGSISRNDAALGNDHTFNNTIFNEAAQFFGGSTIDASDAALARITRHKISKETNPKYVLSKAHRQGSFTEAAFYLSIMGDPGKGVVKEPDYLLYWFRNRRLPYALGWEPRIHETNLTTLAALAKKVHKMTPHEPGIEKEEFEFRPH